MDDEHFYVPKNIYLSDPHEKPKWEEEWDGSELEYWGV
jgi:hypothetical protein